MQREARCFHAIGAERGAALSPSIRYPGGGGVGFGMHAACWRVARFGHSRLAFPPHTHTHSHTYKRKVEEFSVSVGPMMT